MTYQEWARRKQTKRPAGRERRRPGVSVALGPRERRRLGQLLACLGIFAVVLAGKGAFPEHLTRLREMLRGSTDLSSAFVEVGRSLALEEPAVETLAGLCEDVFRGTSPNMVPLGETHGALLEQRFRTGEVWGIEAADCLALLHPQPEEAPPRPFAGTHIRPAPAPEPVPQEPAVTAVAYEGPALPAGATMDRHRLDVGKTVTPVLGWVSSGFGWREHPVDGGEKFHRGVDLAVNTGTPVLAFADGTVDYIGESPIYGLYLQLAHAGGVTSFYAHCDKLLVGQGQTVRAGEKVALSGATGNATGPHLHFELQKDGVRLNPVYYIETE